MKRREFFKRLGIAAVAVSPVAKIFAAPRAVRTVGQDVSSLNITDQGLDRVLDWYFTGKSSDYQVGLIDNNQFTATSTDDTYENHSGWRALDESARFTPVTEFEITSAATVRGVFIYNEGENPTLFSTKVFSEPIAVVNGDTLRVNFNLED